MGEPSWKGAERRHARRMGTERQPLSGIRGGRTHSDTQHPTVYSEHKHTQKAAILTLLAKTRKLAKREEKLPLVIHHLKGTQQVAVTLDGHDFYHIWDLLCALADATISATDKDSYEAATQARELVGISRRAKKGLRR